MIGPGTVLLGRLDWRIVWASLGLVGALILGAIVISMVERWRKRSDAAGLGAGDQLSHFRELYEQGVLTKEEFEQIRAQLAGKLREELHLKDAPPAEPSATESPPLNVTEPPPNGLRPG